MKNFLVWIKKSVTNIFNKGFRFLFRAFFRLFWFLFRTSSFILGAFILILILIGLIGYWVAGERIERTLLQQQGQFGFNFGAKGARDKQHRKFSIDRKGYLKFDLTQLSNQWASPSSFLPFLDKRGNLSRITLLETLEQASKDDNISAIAVTTSSLAMAQLGVAGVEDLRKAIEAFRAQGKMAWIYATDMGGIGAGSGLKSYYLASSFDSISLAPSGSLGFGGVRIEVPYIRNALDKLQITPEFDAREDYKGFPQQFLNSSISEEVKENLQGMADGVARQWSKEVERTRRLDSEIVARTLASPYISASDAQLRGLIDRIAYADKFREAFQNTLKSTLNIKDAPKDADDREETARAAANAIPLAAYASYHRLGQFIEDEQAYKRKAKKDKRKKDKRKKESKEENKEASMQEAGKEAGKEAGQKSEEESMQEAGGDAASEEGENLTAEAEMEQEEPAEVMMEQDSSKMARVALLSWRGQIARESPQGDWEDGQTISARRATRLLRRLAQDERFDAVVLHINSPGGDYVASDLIYHELINLRKKKPVAVVMGDIAASGGYYIAMAGERVFAQPLTITGSIGVFAGKVATRDFWQRWGIDWSVVQSGGDSTMHSLIDSYTEDDLTALTAALDAIYADFTGKVAAARDLDSARIQALAGGRVWLGEQAVANELADAIGGFTEAKAWIAERLQRPQETILFLPYPQHSWSSRLRRALRQAVSGRGQTNLLGPISTLLPIPLPLDAQRTAVRHIVPLLSRRGALSAPHILLMP